MIRNRIQLHTEDLSTKHLTAILYLSTAAILCVTAAYLYTHPIPQDTQLKITTLEQLLGEQAKEDSFALMGLDVSATELIVHDNGQVFPIYISSGTVADALEIVGIELGEFDELSIDDDTTIHNGMEVYITRVTVQEQYHYEPIPYETVTQSSSSLYTGSELVIQKGKNGTRRYTYDLIYKNGVLTNRILSGTSVYESPVNEIIAHGTSTSIPPSSYYTVSSTSQLLTLEDGTQLRYDSYIDVVATAYTTEGETFNITKSGAVAKYGIIAVDPKVIPLGTKMYVVAADGSWVYGYCIAGDTGGFIKGNRIDLFYDTYNECILFGRQNARVYILDA